MVVNGSGVLVGVMGTAVATQVCRAASGLLSFCSSSLRYKENVNNLTADKDKVFALRPVSFKWKDRDENGVGLIAEEVQQIFPEMVFYNDGLVEGVNYDQLSVYLLDVVRNMDSDIKSLSARIGELEKNLTE